MFIFRFKREKPTIQPSSTDPMFCFFFSKALLKRKRIWTCLWDTEQQSIFAYLYNVPGMSEEGRVEFGLFEVEIFIEYLWPSIVCGNSTLNLNSYQVHSVFGKWIQWMSYKHGVRWHAVLSGLEMWCGLSPHYYRLLDSLNLLPLSKKERYLGNRWKLELLNK